MKHPDTESQQERDEEKLRISPSDIQLPEYVAEDLQFCLEISGLLLLGFSIVAHKALLVNAELDITVNLEEDCLFLYFVNGAVDTA